MADAVGLASGLVALATFAFQASVNLRNLIVSYQRHPKSVRDLLDELKALEAVLTQLQEAAPTIQNVDLSALEFPLKRCGAACGEFQKEIERHTTRSGSDRTSFRDWLKLKYMGDDISAFGLTLAGYKSTITVALAYATLRQTSATAEMVREYSILVRNAVDDFNQHMESIKGKIEISFANPVTAAAEGGDEDLDELEALRAELLSTQKSIEMCTQLSNYLEEIQRNQAQNDPNSGNSSGSESLHSKIVKDGLDDLKEDIQVMVGKLEALMSDLMNRMIEKSKTTTLSEEEVTDLTRLRDEWETALQCRNVYAKADSYLKDHRSVIENYASGDDSVQIMVSTNNKTLRGQNRGFGARLTQVGGHMNDLSFQAFAQNFARSGTTGFGEATSTSSNPTSTPPARTPGNAPESGLFKQYGQGYKLPPG
ncbi:hypothetical protein BX600DRAFT_65483 [Xylariales sp. PMI_506]|nr:hypothetical protein BX600DRAFT_65483 [Xylariales sp. PMI_506]